MVEIATSRISINRPRAPPLTKTFPLFFGPSLDLKANKYKNLLDFKIIGALGVTNTEFCLCRVLVDGLNGILPLICELASAEEDFNSLVLN